MIWNPFRVAGDVVHLLSFIIILAKILATRQVHGLSFRSSALQCLIFYTRYVNILWVHRFWWNIIFKVLFLSLTTAIAFLIRFKRPYCFTYDKKHDVFPIWPLILGAIVATALFHRRNTFANIIWTFSEFLEVVVILPQSMMLRRFAEDHEGCVETLTSQYIFSLGLYRLFYICNWVFRKYTEPLYWNPVVWTCGTIQTILVSDFMYYFFKSVMNKKKFTLP